MKKKEKQMNKGRAMKARYFIDCSDLSEDQKAGWLIGYLCESGIAYFEAHDKKHYVAPIIEIEFTE